jgi:uncharacterized protein
MSKTVVARLVLVCAPATLLACSESPLTRFYVLRAMSPSAAVQARARTGREVAVGPVDIPEYLDRPQIVTRADPGSRVSLAEYDRWAEPLGDSIRRVLVENLSILLPSARISVFPVRSETAPDFQLPVRVERLDVAAGSATLEVWWSILDTKGATLSPSSQFRLVIPVEGHSYDAVVGAESLVLAQLSREIADKLRTFGLQELPPGLAPP